MANPLDDIPLDVLVALLEAAAEPTTGGRARAELRAREAGFSLQCAGAPPDPPGVEVEAIEASWPELLVARAEHGSRPIIVLDFSSKEVVHGVSGLSLGPPGEA